MLPLGTGRLALSERVERRLTAILAADVAGYSRLMGADEEGTLAQLKSHRRAVVDPKIAEHRGRIVKTMGDGMLVDKGIAALRAARAEARSSDGSNPCGVEVRRDRAASDRIKLGGADYDGRHGGRFAILLPTAPQTKPRPRGRLPASPSPHSLPDL